MTMRHVCSWQHQLLQEEDGHMEFDSHLGKKLLLPGLMHKLDTENPQRKDYWTCLKVRWSFGVPDSWKSLWDILQDTADSDWTAFKIFCFMKMSAGNYGPEGWRWILQRYKRTLGDCTGSEMSLSFLEFESCLFFVCLGNNISFWSLWWSWRAVSYSFP